MRARIRTILRRGAILLAVCAVTVLALRAFDAQRGPPLEPWHIYVPHELRAADLDRLDWAAYLKAEDTVFEDVRRHVTDTLTVDGQIPFNRYFAGSPVYPASFSQDWDRSYELQPDGAPGGAAVFLDGLTDSPYSSRALARAYRAGGYVAIAIRLPAHGTVPAALTDVEWEDWRAATRLAVREARRLAGPDVPLHLIGYSNGGALAVQDALDALDDE